MDGKPVLPTQAVQLALFEGFFVEDKDQSRTLDIYDALPKFSLSWARGTDGEENLREFNNVQIGGQVIKVAVSAAVLSTKKQPGAKDAGGAVKGKVVFAGVREELVERALRKMAVQRQVEASLEDDPKDGRLIPFPFTLSQLRAELAAAGHNFKIAQLREALDVLGRSMLTIEGLEGDKISGFSHPLMQIAYQCRQGDRTGEQSYYRAVFHPLATRAILEGAWQPINYARVMRLGLPLSRWIATRMNNRFRSAEKGAAIKGRGYFLTLSRILAESGLTPEKRLRNTLARVREALKELQAEGFLDRMKAYDEEITHERTKGRSRIQEVRWTLYPSNLFVEEIIQGNVQVRQLKSGAGDTSGGRKSESQG